MHPAKVPEPQRDQPPPQATARTNSSASGESAATCLVRYLTHRESAGKSRRGAARWFEHQHWTVLVLGALLTVGGLMGSVDALDEGQGVLLAVRLLFLAIVVVALAGAAHQLRPRDR